MKEIYYLFGILCYAIFIGGRPNGAPGDSCFYMTPRHLHPHTGRKVFPTRAMGLYNITTSADIFRPDRAIRVTLWGPPFKGFMLVAAEEGAKDWPTGVFYSEDGSCKQISCLARKDTATHMNTSYKDSVSMLWYGPENMMSEQIQFIATVVVNLTIYYTNIKSGLIRLDPTLSASRAGAEGAAGAVTMDPWLSGNSVTQAAPSNWWNNIGRRSGSSGNNGWGNSRSSSGTGWGRQTSGSSSGWGSNTGSSSGGWGANSWQTSGTGSSSSSGGNNGWGASSSVGSNGWGQGTGSSSSGSSNGWGQGTGSSASASSGSNTGTGTGKWGSSSDWQQHGTGSLTSSNWGSNTGIGTTSAGWAAGDTAGNVVDTASTGTGTSSGAGAGTGTGTGAASGASAWSWDSQPATTVKTPAAATKKAPVQTAGPASSGTQGAPQG